jgi:hypothetical protein
MSSEESRDTTGERPSRRHAQRIPVRDLLVAIDAPEIAEQPWVVDAFDINSRGLGLVLPPELPEGTEVFLTFRLDEENEFSQVPARVTHQMGVSGGVRFEPWSADKRLELLEFLVSVYESPGESQVEAG